MPEMGDNAINSAAGSRPLRLADRDVRRLRNGMTGASLTLAIIGALDLAIITIGTSAELLDLGQWWSNVQLDLSWAKELTVALFVALQLMLFLSVWRVARVSLKVIPMIAQTARGLVLVAYPAVIVIDLGGELLSRVLNFIERIVGFSDTGEVFLAPLSIGPGGRIYFSVVYIICALAIASASRGLAVTDRHKRTIRMLCYG